ncbi:MAG: hypothetical protein JWN99_2522, partial [Ilumatobacteraceae bacterium]|nr:hypothetical protein [Ilumatobacteraceae bacterium]
MASRRRVLFGVAAVVVLSAGAGFAAAQQISSPAEQAAEAQPPVAGPVTAPLETRTLRSQVVTRGDAVFDDAIDLRVDTSRLDGPAVATGEPLAVGSTIDESQVILEIAGRPVIALGGDLPTYRDLTPGSKGPDVAQLEVVLQRMGIDTGTVDDTFDSSTSAAVAQLYEQIGYDAPSPPPAVLQRLTAAQSAVADANDAVDAAEHALTEAQKGPTESERLSLNSAVTSAQRALDLARTTGDVAQVASATEQLQIAMAQRDEGLTPADTSIEQLAVATAQATRQTAELELWNSTVAAQTPLPAAEVVFVPDLPRRVDASTIVRGRLVDGPIMTISGATVVVRSTVSAVDRPLLTVGMPVVLGDGDGGTVDGSVGTLDDTDPTAPVATIVLTSPTTEQLEAIRGRNVQVTFPVASTNGDVLCAPLAALSAGSGGESRVELLHDDGTTEVVPVTVGLVADGFA